ncbi:xanthine dehydrogenase accessory protein XdhC [Roseobacter cerasinus]|uniref:Xanthine dehydrogenase accessory protein XdhC n=1 Tax=Roseobacter cerasinus TaxID=2602289 RepID=A0A640VXT3_9RHOB|nr:xanthine dehydrogenase accessory protein XdhC [Roseobacter cerasinus]GFE51026.1 xanthine dehydrogenase accessory protein XdhC [Roseobacter cerasinus]
MSAIFVEIAATRGSVPREVGTAMKVTRERSFGTIGGGALELEAIQHARAMLEADGEDTRTLPLGPGLGQCCGGSVTLRFTRTPLEVDQPAPPADALAPPEGAPELWLWGAGHVGRAVVAACPARSFNITWVDDDAARFPETPRVGVTVITARDMPRLVASAPRGAHHLIFTYAHDIDLALCVALLESGFASCGLIGSETKWARFRKRLSAAGLDPDRITCPIGDTSRGKRPDAIAAGVVEALLLETKAPV